MNESSTEVLSVGSTAIESIQRAEIDVQIATAKRYPRNLIGVKKSMLSFATLDQETAEGCFYSLPRGGKTIQGPSVRLAEIAVSCYGNLRAGSRIIETVAEGPNPHVVVQAVAHDLETNTAITVEKRRRITKKKSKDKVDEDDINLAANAGASIAFRDAVFRVVPLALVKPVYEAARQVAIGDAKSLSDRRARAIESFAKMGVSKEKVLSALGRTDVEAITLEDLGTLLGLHTSIKEGDLQIDEAFPAPQTTKPDMAAAAAAAKGDQPVNGNTKEQVKEPAKEAAKQAVKDTPEHPEESAKIVPMPSQPERPEVKDPVKEPEPTAPTTPQSEPAPNVPTPGEPQQPEPTATTSTTGTASQTVSQADMTEEHAAIDAFLNANGVPMERFLYWLKNCGRFPTAEAVGFLGIPREFLGKLAGDKALSKCVGLYGVKPKA